jgi:hypothetical protein
MHAVAGVPAVFSIRTFPRVASASENTYYDGTCGALENTKSYEENAFFSVKTHDSLGSVRAGVGIYNAADHLLTCGHQLEVYCPALFTNHHQEGGWEPHQLFLSSWV